ncbi:MAG: DUF1501 domain-containing protein [Planctomycetaceae bacterium]
MTDIIQRRQWLQRSGMGFGSLALMHMLQNEAAAASVPTGGLINPTHHTPKAKRVIYLFQAGGPSQLETWDYKPMLNKLQGTPLPDSVRQGQRLTGMSGNQAILPIAGSLFKFAKHGQNGTWVSELMPHMAAQVDRIALINSMYTEAINHDPAITFLQTGSQVSGRPSIGSWLHYGLGSDSENLPAFVVLITKGKGGQPLYSRLWGSGFLPARYQGVQFRSGKEPVLYLSNPPGTSRDSRRNMLDRLNDLHRLEQERIGDLELTNRIEQYEMAYRMQASVPEVANISDEPQSILDLYGPDATKPGTFASNCLLARRLAERGVRFIQLYHQGWDQHGNLPNAIKTQCRETDQPSAALLQDLADRGMLDDTLVIWGGEFGRTNYSQGTLTATNYGRDHHPRCFSMWMAGGGIRPGVRYGQTCEFGYNIAADGVHVRDFHATLMHLMGIDHERFTAKFQGLDARLTGVVPAEIIREIIT